MSLNGLEAANVVEAYQSALNEGGGWLVFPNELARMRKKDPRKLMIDLRSRFLLKYNTRDEVGLLHRGKGGVGEIQEAVNAYEEESPLYGFIHYRRRKVVLKYVPEGTSRLLQGMTLDHERWIMWHSLTTA